MSHATTTQSRSSFKENTRKSTSESNLLSLKNLNDELPLNDAERNLEKLETMKVRKNALEETLEKKLNELRSICIREAELTGTLPKEFPLKENEELPIIRRRVRTEFTFSDKLLMQPKTKEEEKLTKLELEFEIQCKIVKATSKLCNEMNTKKSIKKQRKQVYQQALAKLKDIEKNLQLTKKLIDEEASIKMKRKNSMRLDADSNSGDSGNINNKIIGFNSLNDEFQSEDEVFKQPNFHLNFDLFTRDPPLLAMSSAPTTPVKCKLRNKMPMIGINEHQLFDHNATSITNPRIENLIKQRHTNHSPEYDTISSNNLGSSVNNMFLDNYCRINNYEELIENSPETEVKKLFGVSTRRSAIAPNLSQDDCSLANFKQPSGLLSSLDKCTNERLKSLTRHNSLDKVRQSETCKENVFESNDNRISSSNLLSPNLFNSQQQINQFNFGLVKNINKSQNNINMAQRPLPSPPTEHKKLSTTNRSQQLNLNNASDHSHLRNSFQTCSIKNPIKSPSSASMFQQSPLDFEKATNLYLQQLNEAQLENQNSNRLEKRFESTINDSTESLRNNVIKPSAIALTINTSNDQQISSNLTSSNQQTTVLRHHSPVPLLPPRTPNTNKPNLLNSLNSNSMNSLNSNSYHQTSSNHTNSSCNSSHRPSWAEACMDTLVMPNQKTNFSNNYVQNSNFISANSMGSLNDNNQQLNNKFNVIKYNQFIEKENQLTNSNVPSSRTSHQLTKNKSNQFSNNQSMYQNQLIKENSQSSLSSNSMLTSSNSSSILSSNASSTNLHTSSQIVFQPFIEEIKPYELSDFYKYSTKYKNAQNLKKETNNELSPQTNVQNNFRSPSTQDKNDSSTDNSELIEDSFLAKNHVASEFSSELKTWLKEKYNKTATLV